MSTFTPSETDYSYVAGLIDGEGCSVAWIGKPRSGTQGSAAVVRLVVVNTSLSVLEWCIQASGLPHLAATLAKRGGAAKRDPRRIEIVDEITSLKKVKL